MKLQVFKALWGMSGALDEQIRKIADAGYEGLEAGLPAPDSRADFGRLLKEHRLAYTAMVFTGGTDAGEHVDSLREQVELAKAFEPVAINAHSGLDRWSPDLQRAYFEGALEVEQKAHLAINHETHRGRILFTPWVTADRLREFPELGVTADFSHFVCVCESDLKRDAEDLALCIQRSRHIHGRVGHEEGPQVSDPRAPEWRGHLDRHMEWWLQIARTRHSAGAEYLTFTPELGPPNYQPVLPYTRQPVADLWDCCLFVAQEFRQRVARLTAL